MHETDLLGIPAPEPMTTAVGLEVAPPPLPRDSPTLEAVSVLHAVTPSPGVPPRTTPGVAYLPARPSDVKLSTGVTRLDALLGGGYTPGTATLLYGPPYCGKQVLQQHAIIGTVRAGLPVTVLLHTVGAEAMSRRLARLEGRVVQAENEGLLHYVDMNSHALGEPTDHPNTTYVKDPRDLSQVLKATARPRAPGAEGLLAVESTSTLVLDLGAAKAFTVMRSVLSRSLNRGGVGLLGLEGGMHPDTEVQMGKHLCAGMIELAKKGEAHRLHVEGLETAYTRPGWIDYEFTAHSFRLTGGFASRRI